MKTTERFLNVSQSLITTLKEGSNLQTNYLFQPEEAKHLIRLLDLFCNTKRFYINVSFYYNPKVDKTLNLRVYNKPFGYHKELVNYLSGEEKVTLDSIKIGKTPDDLRFLILKNFM